METFPREKLDPKRTTGLILCGMGGPDGPDAVQPFLRNLFQDPLIFPVPRLVAGLAGRLIAWRRAPEVRERYAMVSEDSATPQLPTTIRQAELLAARMNEAGRPTVAGVAMRYWDPFPDQTVAELMGEGARQFLIVPTYPQYSGATNGSTIDYVLDSLARITPGATVNVVADWNLLPGFIESLARPASERISAWADDGLDPERCSLVYVAHSLPMSFIKKGDPYLLRTQETIKAVHDKVTARMAALGRSEWFDALLAGGREPCLTFQSKVGPIAWLGPQIDQEVPRLGAEGCRHLMVQPVSFTCEHIETLLELDIELKEEAAAAGIADFNRGAALNLDPVWLDSLAEELLENSFAPEVDSFVP
jgi:ferrochelatase